MMKKRSFRAKDMIKKGSFRAVAESVKAIFRDESAGPKFPVIYGTADVWSIGDAESPPKGHDIAIPYDDFIDDFMHENVEHGLRIMETSRYSYLLNRYKV